MTESRHIILMLDTARGPDRRLIRGLVDYFHQHGLWSFYRFSPLYLTRPFYFGRQDSMINRLLKGDADGFFGYLPEQKSIQQVIRSGFPAVIVPVKTRIPDVPNIIDASDVTGTTAAEYFLSRGYQNIAYCGFEHYWSRVRQEGFCHRLAESQRTPYVYSHPKSSKVKYDTDLRELGQWLVDLPKPIGIMACNDDRAFDVLQACQKKGIKVPDQVSVLGVDNDEMICNLVSPALSSIDLNFEKTGYEAARLLHQMILDKQRCNDTLMLRPTEILTRQSTDMIAVEDTEVAKALRFIRLHARKEIQVRDIVDASSISRRSLQQRFRAILDHSIYEEIRRVRMNHVAELLMQTNLTIQQIAQELDFQDIHHISRAFRKEKGMTPSVFRKLHKHS